MLPEGPRDGVRSAVGPRRGQRRLSSEPAEGRRRGHGKHLFFFQDNETLRLARGDISLVLISIHNMPFDHFDLIAGIYDRGVRYSVPAVLRELLDLPSEGYLLDAAGGTGQIADALRGSIALPVVADRSPGMLRRARAKSLPVICTLVEDLPFADGTFTRIIMRDVFHHLLDQRVTVGELWRVLAQGGRMIIVEPDITVFSVKLLALIEKLLLMRSHFFSAEWIAGLFSIRDARIDIIRQDSTVYLRVEKVKLM